MKEKVEFAGNYPGPLYAPHPDLIKEKKKENDRENEQHNDADLGSKK